MLSRCTPLIPRSLTAILSHRRLSSDPTSPSSSHGSSDASSNGAHASSTGEALKTDIVDKIALSEHAVARLRYAHVSTGESPSMRSFLQVLYSQKKAATNIEALRHNQSRTSNSTPQKQPPAPPTLTPSLPPSIFSQSLSGHRSPLQEALDALRSDPSLTKTLWARWGPHLRTHPDANKPENLVEQLRFELAAVDAAVARFRSDSQSASQRGDCAQLGPVRSLLLKWFEEMQREVVNVQKFLADVSSDHEYKARFRALLRRKKIVEKTAAKSKSEDAASAKSKGWRSPVANDPTFGSANGQNGGLLGLNAIMEDISTSELPIIEPFFATLGAEKIAVVAINCVINRVLADPKGHGTASLAIAIGNALMAEINLKDTSLHPLLFKRFSPLYAKKQERMRSLYRQQRQKLKKSLGTSSKDAKNLGHQTGPLASAAAVNDTAAAIVSQQITQHEKASAEAAAMVAQESRGWLSTIMAKLKQSVSGNGAAADAVDPGIINPEWSDQFTMQVQARLGAVVLTILLRSCTIELPTSSRVNSGVKLNDEASNLAVEERKPIPAFYHAYLHSKMKRIGIIKATDAVYHHIEMAGEYAETMHPRHQPMVAKPLPWTSAEQGGYLTIRDPIMRLRCRSQLQLLRHHEKNMTRLYDGLNALAATRWCVNDRIFDIMHQVWEAGGGIAGVPSRTNLPVPVLSLLQDSQAKSADGETSQTKFQALKQLRNVMKHNAELHSLRTDFLYKLETARVFRGHEFYLPHNVDFRGRAYPMPIHLHHLGSDVCRGLLRFAEKKPLQARGLFWLKVHLANLFGKNKMNFDGRVEWTESNRDNIISAASDPLGPAKSWWLDADEPWQALAVCFELAEVYRSPCPEAHMTGVPVHMDGSCNGLQHYAALGRDVAGAAEVNLINADQPSDPYRSVAERLQVIMDGMSRDDSNPQQQQLAKFLTSRIGRKVVKQTVMTSVYGVTFIGARAQIHRQLVDLTRGEPNVSEDMLFRCSGLLARETLNALAQTFSGAKAVMTWLARVASFVAKKTGKPITWVTPLGLPVLQPYRSSGSYQVKTCLQHVVLARDTDHLPVNSRKQSTAFAPNFIHSIDSTHLLMTASDCAARGVHDSFWTHPGDVDEMGRSLRKQFVQLHSLPLLEDFRSQVLQQFRTQLSRRDSQAEVKIPISYDQIEKKFDEECPLPPRGDLDLKEVEQASFFFS